MGDEAILVDGNSMTYGWDWQPGLFHNDQRVSGVINFLLNIRKKAIAVGKSNILVAWDSRGYQKKEFFPEYKATRKKGEFDRQIWDEIDKLKVAIPMLGVKSVEVKGLEADQVVASFALYLKESGYKSISIVSFDTDMFQMIRDGVVVETRNGITMDVAALSFKENLSPEMFLVRKILGGDKSDNIPGIPKYNGHLLRKLIRLYGEDQKAILGCKELEPHRAIIERNNTLIRLKMDIAFDKLEETWSLPVKVRAEEFRKFCIRNGLIRIAGNFNEWMEPFMRQG